MSGHNSKMATAAGNNNNLKPAGCGLKTLGLKNSSIAYQKLLIRPTKESQTDKWKDRNTDRQGNSSQTPTKYLQFVCRADIYT